MRADNSQHLIAAAQRRRADTLERARHALHELVGLNTQRYTITQIAAHAGVSRSWLYTQPELRDQIQKLTAPANSNAPQQHIERGSDASLRQRLTLANERIRELDDDNRQLA